MFGRLMVALALLLALVATSVAQDKNPESRIAATFYQTQGAAQRSKAPAAAPDKMLGAFKVDPDAPIHIEADRLVEVFDGTKQGVHRHPQVAAGRLRAPHGRPHSLLLGPGLPVWRRKSASLS